MAEFDREELKAAIEAGKIPASDDNIRRLDGLLRVLAQQYRARKVAREQDLNGQLTRLEETKSFLTDLWHTEPFLYAFEAEAAQIIGRLSDAVQRGRDFLKSERERRKVRGDDPETTLFTDLRKPPRRWCSPMPPAPARARPRSMPCRVAGSASSPRSSNGTRRRNGEAPPQLFISYASGDVARAEALHARLTAAGFEVWFDQARLVPGCDWHKDIEVGCEAARVILPLRCRARGRDLRRTPRRGRSAANSPRRSSSTVFTHDPDRG
jgi:hypothetical protein